MPVSVWNSRNERQNDDVEDVLRALRVVLHQHFERREAQLRVARLVGLDARQQVREVDVAGLHGVGRERDELDVGEAVLDGQAGGHRGLDAVGVEHPVVEEVLHRQHAPLVGVEGLVAPVEALVVLEQVVRERQVELRVADLVEHAEHAEVAPARRRREAAEAALHRDRHLLDHAGRAHVQLRGGGVAGVELLVDVGALERLAHRVGAGLLLALHAHVVAEGDAVGLVPGVPGLLRHVADAGPRRRETPRCSSTYDSVQSTSRAMSYQSSRLSALMVVSL